MTETDVAERVKKLTMIDQNLQACLNQKQQFQAQLFEIENALSELEKTEKAFKIVGNIMVASPKEDLQKDLMEKKEVLDLRMKSVEKQEETLKQKAEEIRKDVFNDKQ